MKENELITGRNPILEALKSGREIDSLYVQSGAVHGSAGKIIALCRERGAAVIELDSRKMESLCGTANHQGVAARVAAHAYASVDDILKRAADRGEAPFIIICDEIEDPHNLGALIRTAECAGAHGLILPKRRSAPLSCTVSKTAAGALEYMPVARVSNLAETIDGLKRKGIWIYGADLCGDEWCSRELTGAAALVIGSEGRGIGRLIREKCDFILSLPMAGQIGSLNASVAAGIIMYEFLRQRQNIKAFKGGF